MATKKKAKKDGENRSRARKAASKKTIKKKKCSPQHKTTSKRPASRNQINNSAKKVRTKKRTLDSTLLRSRKAQTPSGDADSQGLSAVERADSESVSELLEEGNTFEAGVIQGVEKADDADESEVRTHEVPEDDVPEEYLDND